MGCYRVMRTVILALDSHPLCSINLTVGPKLTLLLKCFCVQTRFFFFFLATKHSPLYEDSTVWRIHLFQQSFTGEEGKRFVNMSDNGRITVSARVLPAARDRPVLTSHHHRLANISNFHTVPKYTEVIQHTSSMYAEIRGRYQKHDATRLSFQEVD